MKTPVESAKTESFEKPARLQPSLRTSQSEASANPSPLVIEGLLLRMRSGDRDAAAAFLMRYGSRIRRRIRGKLGPEIRRLFDSMEILSTLGRRLDIYVMSGRLQAANEDQLWSLVFKIADNAMIDKARLFKRLQTVESEDGEFAHDLSMKLRQVDEAREDEGGVEIEIDNCIRTLRDATDRRILSLWLTGEPHSNIAAQVDLTPTAVRKRWEKIKVQLKDRLLAVA